MPSASLLKAAAVNALKMSQVGRGLCLPGMNRYMPVMHGAQGCTSFGLVLLVRDFREAIPLQTTAMNEVSSTLGGMENIAKAVLNIRLRAKRDLIAICSTGLTETKGDDVNAYLRLTAEAPRPGRYLTGLCPHALTTGASQDGWAKALEALAGRWESRGRADARQADNLLAGCHLTPADIEEMRDIVQSFGLEPIVLPDVSSWLDGHLPDNFSPTSMGGTTLAEMRALGASIVCIANRRTEAPPTAQAVQELCGVPYVVFDRLTGLQANDRFLAYLEYVSGQPIPARYRRQRSQLQDAMLGWPLLLRPGVKVAIGAEPEPVAVTLRHGWPRWAAELGGCRDHHDLAGARWRSPQPGWWIGANLEAPGTKGARARACAGSCWLTHSHGGQAAERLHIPFHRAGLPPCSTGLGAGHCLSVGYRGTRGLIFEIGQPVAGRGPCTYPG
uniref:Nitrogenase iron-molybdenum cofactor biosynthesis protein NifN n=1 Tax=Herbaspirillum seropedicae TaxID=964 RepID=NIFN_HERSE|nr:RecName: Full=Nitrogenase iron-molybdenum cofactor biosynthesis protein NifN [Herbaspirillum seropedicae]AAC43020.1 iron-molybdenum cofactor biosynthesis subunit [Herbaspirillum seropedicae]